MPKTSKRSGFTLIELLVVIAIIGLLSSGILVALNSARSKSRDARRVSDVRQIMTSMELYFAENSAYPDDGGSCVAASGGTAVAGLCPTPTATGPSGSASSEYRDYMPAWPIAPSPADGSCANGASGASGTNDYIYDGRNAADTASQAADPSFYRVTFCLGNTTGSYAAGARTATPNGIS